MRIVKFSTVFHPLFFLLCLLAAKPASSQEAFEEYLQKRLPNIATVPFGTLKASPRWLPAKEYEQREDIDEFTGLVLPPSPFEQAYSKLPEDDPRTLEYIEALRTFFRDREKIMQVRHEYMLRLGEMNLKGLLDEDVGYVASKVQSWNGDIFWAPASKTPDYVGEAGRITKAGDELRAVFGPIPNFDVSVVTSSGPITRSDGSTFECRILGLQVDGNSVELRPNTSKPGNPLEFEHTDVSGTHVKWTEEIEKCDKPSLAGGVTPCGTSSRLSIVKSGNVEWIALARKTRGVEPLTADEYWEPSNPEYPLLGYIGFNRVSGEVAFLAEKPGADYSFDVLETPPGGNGYNDAEGRSSSKSRYDPSFSIQCARCHDNKEPRTITPYIKQARVGYANTARRDAFSVGSLLPKLPRLEDQPYRVVGSDFTVGPNRNWIDNSKVLHSVNRCTNCHVITTAEGSTLPGTALFAAESVNRLDDLAPAYNSDNKISSSRTDWSLRGGDGKIHPWMTVRGNILANSSGQPHPEITQDEWDELRGAITSPTLENSLPLYTKAPAPESIVSDDTRIADNSYASILPPVVTANRDADNPSFPKEVQFKWSYHNRFGGIPTRDDVRFNVAVREVEIPDGGDDPDEAEYPTIEQARGEDASRISGAVFKDGDIVIIKDASFVDHLRWTDPRPTATARDYAVIFPAASGKRYLVRLLSKRYTFDKISRNSVEPGIRYSEYDHRYFIDVN